MSYISASKTFMFTFFFYAVMVSPFYPATFEHVNHTAYQWASTSVAATVDANKEFSLEVEKMRAEANGLGRSIRHTCRAILERSHLMIMAPDHIRPL